MLASQTTTRPSKPGENGGRRRETPQMIRQRDGIFGVGSRRRFARNVGLFPKVLSRGERVSGLAGGAIRIRTGSGALFRSQARMGCALAHLPTVKLKS